MIDLIQLPDVMRDVRLADQPGACGYDWEQAYVACGVALDLPYIVVSVLLPAGVCI